MKFIKITNLAGVPILLNLEQISEILPNSDGSYTDVAKTIIVMVNGNKHAIHLSPDDVEGMLRYEAGVGFHSWITRREGA